MVLHVRRGLAMMGMVVHVVCVMVIVVARADRVIVIIVGDNHSTILIGRWATIAWVIVGIVAIPQVDSLGVSIGIAPGGCSIVNLHLSTDRGRGRLFPAGGLHALVCFTDIAPVGCALLHRTRTAP